MKTGFEFTAHTADIGIRVSAVTVHELLKEIAAALYSALGELTPAERGSTSQDFQYDADSHPLLLRDFLADLLYFAQQERLLLHEASVNEFSHNTLSVSVTFRPIDEERSRFEREVKAVTYHGLELHNLTEGYEFNCILDI